MDEPHDSVERELAWENEHGPRAGLATLAAGVLLVGSAIAEQFVVFASYPSVGLIQGLGAALQGHAEPAVNPRLSIITFLDRHATGTLLWGALGALGTALIAVALGYLYLATKARRPELPPIARTLAIAGPVAVGLASLARLIVLSRTAHDFLHKSDHSRHAVEQALSPPAVLAVGYVALAASLAMGFAFVMISLNAMRAGLLTRFMGVLGIIAGVLFVIPIGSPLPVVQAFWLVALSALIARRWPGAMPPAWAAGEARPWPSQQQLRQQRDAAREHDEPSEVLEGTASVDPDTPAPPPAALHPTSTKRKRKRRA